MTVYVVGLGSMGKRRIRLILENENIEVIGVDSNASRAEEAQKLYQIKTFPSLRQAREYKEGTCAFVCTSPLSHAGIIEECLENGLHVFTEINLVSDGYARNMALAKEKGLVLFLSSTFLYRAETEYIAQSIRGSKAPKNYIYHVGQYLPDWHPWENYNDFFVGNVRTNGCREIFAIELPWIVSCFGPVEKIAVEKSKNSSLNIGYDDNYLVSMVHTDGTKGVFAVDVVSRKAVRKLEVFGEDIYLTWGGTPDTVTVFDIDTKTEKTVDLIPAEHREGYAAFITETPYREEIKAFLEAIRGDARNTRWSFDQDSTVLTLIDEIEGISND